MINIISTPRSYFQAGSFETVRPVLALNRQTRTRKTWMLMLLCSRGEGVGGHPVRALLELNAHILRFIACNPLVDLPGSRKELPEHRSLGRQAGELWHVLGQAHAAVRGANAEAVFTTEEALGCGGHQVEHLLRVDGGVELVCQAVDAVGEGDFEPVRVAAKRDGKSSSPG